MASAPAIHYDMALVEVFIRLVGAARCFVLYLYHSATLFVDVVTFAAAVDGEIFLMPKRLQAWIVAILCGLPTSASSFIYVFGERLLRVASWHGSEKKRFGAV